MRIFIAIDLPQKIKDELVKIQSKLHITCRKKVEKNNMHITLFFIGEIENNKVTEIKIKLEGIKFQKFKLEIDKVGYFEREEKINVVWAGLENESDLKKLNSSIKAMIGEYCKKEDFPFSAHITFARVDRLSPGDNSLLKEKVNTYKLDKIEFEVNEFVLYKSTLTRNGPIYEVIRKYELN